MKRSLVQVAHLSPVSFLLSFIVSCSPAPGSKDDYPQPDRPSPTAQAHNASVTLSWPAVNHASQYLIYWSTTPGGTRDASNPIAHTDLEFEHLNLHNGTTYYYAVAAKGQCCASEKSVELVATPQSPPGAPQNVRAVTVGGVATVSWDPVQTTDRYTVFVVSDSAEVATYDTSATAIAFGNLDDDTTYHVTIKGRNVGGVGEGSVVVSATSAIAAIDSGANHNCAVRPDHSLECWGVNTSGQLGLGDNMWRPSPKQVGADNNWRHVTAGGAHTCAINTNGELFCWGENTDGQLGRPDQTYTTNPSQVGKDTDWHSVSAGTRHTCAIKANHHLWCWGNNDDGQLGVGEVGKRVHVPTLVTGDQVWGSVAAGENHTCAVQLDGVLKCWGDNASGQLGVVESYNKSGSVHQVGDDQNWTAVAVGGKHSCALKTDTSLWCWGSNMFGQLGTSTSETFRSTPQRVGTDLGWTSVDLGKQHSCATRIDGRLWCWGDNELGKLGINNLNLSFQNSPVEVQLQNSWYSVALGDTHTCALFADGRFSCWGDNQHGQLGNGSPRPLPEPVSVSAKGDWLRVFTGWYHVCAIKTDFSVWCWGGSGTQGFTPTLAGAGKPSGPGWISVAMSHTRACALRADETIWCAGMDYGFRPSFFGGQQFGGSGEHWKQVAVTDERTCALRLDQTIWCWGIAYDNQAPAFDASVNWEAIALTPQGLCAIKTDGSRWCQQNNTAGLVLTDTVHDWKTLTVDGRCGIKSNNTLACSIPTGFTTTDTWKKLASNTTDICAVRKDNSLWCGGARIGTENSWVDISVSDNSAPTFPPDVPGFGDSYYCGIKLNSTLWCWGYTRYGQLANATIPQSSTPVSVQNAAAWSSVSAGAFHTCAIAKNDVGTADQRLYCWGDNSYGQLGINSTTPATTPATTPTPVDPDSRWMAVATGVYHSCAIKISVSTTSGSLWCWGANGYGQIGVPSPAGNFLFPTPVGADADWESVSSGDHHICAVKVGGALWCWGNNTYGQVGVGTHDVEIAPIQIEPTTQWKSVAAGSHHTCAITLANALRCWGANDRGQLGTSDAVERLTPTPIQETFVNVWTAVAAGANHTCAITGNALWCWGDNSFGQLADNTDVATRRLTPRASVSSVLKVATGGMHTCMTYLDKYGVWCAGANNSGQMGDGTTLPPKISPSQCNIGLQGSASYLRELTVSAGRQHTCATRADGTLLCWGDNTYGQVGSSQ